jgi:Holliday junction resolvase
MEKKRMNSKRKGNRAELELAKILTKRFGVPFARVGVSSGARPKQVKLDGSAKQSFTSDLIVPDGFRFSVECKAVNRDVDLLDQSALLDKFLTQVTEDANSIGKIPLLCWKRNRKGWIAALPEKDVFGKTIVFTNYYSVYREWLVCYLDALLETEQLDFWRETITTAPPAVSHSASPKLLTYEEER